MAKICLIPDIRIGHRVIQSDGHQTSYEVLDAVCRLELFDDCDYLVSTYALFVDDVVEVFADTVVVRDAAVSRIQRLTKGFWDSQNAGNLNEFEEGLDMDGRQDYAGKQRRSRKSRPKKRKLLDDWELPMDFL